LKPSAFDYAAMSFSENSTPTWFMAMKDGPARVRQWVAANNGSDLRRPGELPALEKKRIADEARRNAAVQRQIRQRTRHIQAVIKRRNRCISKAKTGPQVSRCIEKNPL
jgi:hypothetical protein